MAFLNKKEDVIDLQLTQYGKYLVSQGRFKPYYYAFFDDDIIYDLRYTSGTILEAQNDIEGRVLDDTPSMSAQYLFHGVNEIDIQNQLKSILAGEGEKVQQTPERHYALSDPLSNSELAADKAPSFNIRLNRGIITSSSNIITGSGKKDYTIKNIPQINLRDVTFYSFIGDSETEPLSATPAIMLNFQDGTYIGMEPDHISLTVIEDNVPLSKENFDVEVYVLDQSGSIEYPLYFQKENVLMKDGILLDRPDIERHPYHADEVDADGRPPKNLFDTDEVRYYFDLDIDE